MVWDNEKDEYLCREVLLFEPYLDKPRTAARGNAQKAVAAQVTAAPLCFKVDARAVRERFGGLVERFKAKNRKELAATSVSPEHKEIEYEKDLRELACETLWETSKRKSEESGPAAKKRISNGSDTLLYLREKGGKKQEMKKN